MTRPFVKEKKKSVREGWEGAYKKDILASRISRTTSINFRIHRIRHVALAMCPGNQLIWPLKPARGCHAMVLMVWASCFVVKFEEEMLQHTKQGGLLLCSLWQTCIRKGRTHAVGSRFFSQNTEPSVSPVWVCFCFCSLFFVLFCFVLFCFVCFFCYLPFFLMLVTLN